MLFVTGSMQDRNRKGMEINNAIIHGRREYGKRIQG
jgi:hypothetical protein